jgi:hypothetical protein
VDANFENNEKKKLLRILVELKKILSSLIFTYNLEKRSANQRQILSSLINSKSLLNIFEYRYFNEFKALIQNHVNFDFSDYIEFYCSYISLLAELSWDFSRGIVQARRLVTKDQLKEILIAPNTPFILKKHFLKCFHHIFISGPSNVLRDNHDLVEEILHLTICNDFSFFNHMIEGLVKKKTDMHPEVEDPLNAHN